MNHIVTVKERFISVDNPIVVQNGINADTLQLSLDSEWDALVPVVFIGQAGEDGKTYATYWTGEPVVIPASLLKETGYLPLSIVGYNQAGTVRALTVSNEKALWVKPSGEYDAGVPDDPETLDLLGQLVAAAGNATDAAYDATNAASRADSCADKACKAATDVEQATTDAQQAAEAADQAADKAMEAAAAAGKGCVNVYADPNNEDLVIIEYPAAIEDSDGTSIWLTLEGED